MGSSDKRKNLTEADIIKFSKITASSTDDCVKEIQQLEESKKSKEKELSDFVSIESTLSVEERVRSQREKDRIQREIRTIEKNIEVVKERALILERSCDINQAVATYLRGKEVNYRTTNRVAEIGDITNEVKELKSRLSSKEKRQVWLTDFKKNNGIKKLIKTLTFIALLIIIILLLLRNCGSIKRTAYRIVGKQVEKDSDDSKGKGTSQWNKMGFDKNSSKKGGDSSAGTDHGDDNGKYGGYNDPNNIDEEGYITLPDGTKQRIEYNINEANNSPNGSETSERIRFGFDNMGNPNGNAGTAIDGWDRDYVGKIVRDDLVTIPYKDPAVPFDDMEIDYYLLEGDFASGFNAITGSLLNNLDSSKRYSLSDLIASYNDEHSFDNSEEKSKAPPSLAEQLATEDKRRERKLDPEDDFYIVDITNKGTSKREIIAKMEKDSPFVTMQPKGLPVDLTASIHPYTQNLNRDNSSDPMQTTKYAAGADVAAHYKFYNTDKTKGSVGLKTGAYRNVFETDDGGPKQHVPLLAEVKGTFNNFEAYAGAGVLASNKSNDLLSPSKWGIAPAAELGVGYNMNLPSNEHASFGFGLDTIAAFKPSFSGKPSDILISPYLRYKHSMDVMEPIDNYYYDIKILNNKVKASDFGYDIKIVNEADSAVKKKAEEKKKIEEKLASKLESKNINLKDDYYEIRLLNDAVQKTVKRDEKTSGASNKIADAAIAALMAGDMDSYNLIVNTDATGKDSDNKDKLINEYYNRYQFYEYEQMNNDWLAAQDQNNNALLNNLYGDPLESGQTNYVDRLYSSEETYDGSPIDVELHMVPFVFGAMMYPYTNNIIITESTFDTSGSTKVNSKNGVFVYTNKYGLALSFGAKYRFINKKRYQFFVGAKSMVQWLQSPNYFAFPIFAELGVGLYGLNVYGGIGTNFAGIFNYNAGLAFELGLDYTVKFNDHLGVVVGGSVNYSRGRDDSDDRNGDAGAIVITNRLLTINPYVGMKLSFDARDIQYNDDIPSAQRQYKILVDRGKEANTEEDLTFEDLENTVDTQSDKEV